MGAGEAMAFTESDFQSEGNIPRKFTSWIYSIFSGGVIVSLRDRYELYSISGWSSLECPRWVHTCFCSYYFELSPRDLRFRVLSWESPGTWKHMQGIGPTDREGMRKFSLNIRSPEAIWDRVNAFTSNCPGQIRKQVLGQKSCHFHFVCHWFWTVVLWSLGSGSRPHGGGLEYARNGASSS